MAKPADSDHLSYKQNFQGWREHGGRTRIQWTLRRTSSNRTRLFPPSTSLFKDPMRFRNVIFPKRIPTAFPSPSSRGNSNPRRWGHRSISSPVGISRVEIGRWSTVQTLSKCTSSFPLSAFTLNATSTPDLGLFSAFIEVAENWVGFWGAPKFRPNCPNREYRRNHYPRRHKSQSLARPPSQPRSFTGTTPRLTQCLPDSIAEHWPSAPAPLNNWCTDLFIIS